MAHAQAGPQCPESMLKKNAYIKLIRKHIYIKNFGNPFISLIGSSWRKDEIQRRVQLIIFTCKSLVQIFTWFLSTGTLQILKNKIGSNEPATAPAGFD